MKKLFFIFNPSSGKNSSTGSSSIKSRLWRIIDIFTKGGYIVTTYPTQCHMDACEKIRKVCSEGSYDLIVCSGGDGTLNEVIHGIMISDNKLPLGYIPTGTTNDFAKTLGIPKKVINAAEWIVDGEPFSCDIGSFNERYFTYIAAFGAFTDVSYETPQQFKNIIGHSAYILEGLKRMGSLKSYKMRIEYDGNIIEDEFVFGMITNSSSIGGFLSQDDVLLDDGVYEVTIIKKPSSVVELNLIVASLLNIKESKINDRVLFFRTSKISFYSETEIAWTIDGEYAGSEMEVSIENKNKAVDFYVKKPLPLTIELKED
ncbi:MAG: YegS/Rv2252/BmrU family lipid kinase [Clostridiales bacterium]|nr:YegS/Rv2252/BmrU family lipid kinase [Clostridiales bacterium]